MYTHEIISKEFENGVLVLGVKFTDDVSGKVVTEGVKPQDKAGFEYWLKSRLTSLNSLDELGEVEIGASIDLSEPAVVDTRTQAEKDRDEWFVLYNRWINVKTNLVDTGVVPANNAKVVALLQKVKDGLLPAYIDLL